MQEKFDVLIIGGGPGGLSIGSLLAKEGVSSAILEREPSLGGRYRAVNFHGCRSDNGIRLAPTGMFALAEDTAMSKFLSFLGFPPEYKVIEWTMGIVSKDKPGRIDYAKMDRSRGVGIFFDFFAFGSGMALEDTAKEELTTAFKLMEDMSAEEMRKSVDVSFASWIDRNVKDPMAQTILNFAAPLMGAAAAEVNYGQMANIFGAFPKLGVGGPLFGYPKQGNFEDFVITPLTKYYTDRGGSVFTNRRVRSILIENGVAKGVVVQNTETGFLEEYTAPVVVCAIPIFEAVSKNILGSEFLTKDWAEAIERCANLAFEDLTGFYLLRKDVIPREGPGWVHVFDADYGIPTYVGDWCVGSLFNAVEPPGKQLIFSYIPGGLEATHFGLNSPIDKVQEANRRWEEAVEKVFPGFAESIEFRGMTLQLNWGRYAWAVVPTEIEMQSPNISGLYFAGDTVWSVSSMVSDKVYEIAFPLCERILKYIRS